ncbi:response regulator transcription factor [Xanthobacter sp. DSM 24535]|uniref:LuxR C-terminal-related transcriptional regulator n=1 Tax=Roseixanthobacter psychrophilus TaxID=3119917 RepID=UPI00372893F4
MKVLIADDHWMIRASLKYAMKSVGIAFEPLEASNFQEAMDIVRANPDIELMLIDLVMPGLSEFEGLRTLRSRYPDIPIAVISVHEDREHVLQAISEGVIGYIPKSADGAELLKGLTTVLNGDVYFPRDVLQGSRHHRGPGTEARRDADKPATLTAREDEVLELIAQGLSNFNIAEELGMSPNTVRVHLRNIGRKLNLKDRSEFISYGVTHAASLRETH